MSNLDLSTLRQRAAIIKKVRQFFFSKNYLELDTPLLSSDLIPESCLEVFETTRIFPHGSRKKNRPLWLIPSPEIWMKKIIARHKTNVYQICKCFRNGESAGHLHNSEFTMLEYYTMDADYMDSLALTEELFEFLIGGQGLGIRESMSESTSYSNNSKSTINKPMSPFKKITVSEAFKKYAGFDLFAAAEKPGALEKEAKRLGLEPMPGMAKGALYDLIFIHAVEPNLKKDKPVALIDYPAFVPCLAKKAADGKTAERWELYWKGIELANCFSEETDPQEVKEFFINEAAKKEKTALVKHKIDHDYWKIFESFPRCSGVALGLDRLIMALTGKTHIKSALAFTQ